MEVNDQIRKSGVCNADGLQIPLQSKLNIQFIQEMVKGSQHDKIVKYLKFGWPLGHDGVTIPPEAKQNHKGVKEFATETEIYLNSEKQQGRIFGPHKHKQFKGKNGISPLNSVPRKNDDKRRFILDLSFPKGKGINDGINKETYQGETVDLRYPTIDDLVNLIYKRKAENPGQKVLIWKRDLKSCYRQFQLCPGSVHLVGYRFLGKYWYDLVLAMGSSSSAQICQKITDMVRYIFENRYDDEVRNFLDDFFLAQVESRAEDSYKNLNILLEQIGIDENLTKACPPNEQAVVLGILFDTVTMTLSLTQEKMKDIVSEWGKWQNKTRCTLKQMQSLVGKLSFAAGVVRSGRIYMARLINALRKDAGGQTGGIILSRDIQNDIQWWMEFIERQNGIPMESLMVNKKWEPPGSVWSSDSSSTGLGGWSEKTAQFFHHTLDENNRALDINSLECLALMLCLKKWSPQCRGKKILIYCDNTTTVAVVNSGAAKTKFLQACLREIHHVCAQNSAEIKAVWLKSTENTIADVLSRWDQHPKYQKQFAELTENYNTRETRIDVTDLQFIYTTF